MKYNPKIKGKFIKSDVPQPNGRDFAEGIGGIVSFATELKSLKEDILKTKDTVIEKVDERIEHIEECISEAEETALEAKKIAESVKDTIDEYKEEAIDLIREIKQGEPGKDADEDSIVEKLYKKMPRLDEDKLRKDIISSIPNEKDLVKKVIAKIPENKASLKLITEQVSADPTSVIDKIMEMLEEGKISFKQKHTEGLEQTMRSFQSQLGRGYLHGGGFNNIYSGGSLVTNGLTGLNFTGSGINSVTKDTATGIVTVDISGGSTPSLPFNSVQYNNAGAFGGDDLFTRDPSTYATLIGMLQNAGVDAAGIAIGDDLLGLPGTNGIVMRRGDDADVVGNTLIGIIDATPLGAPSAYMGFSRADDFVTGEFYQQFFFAGNGGISAGDGTDSGLFQVGVGGAELGADNNDGGGNDIIAITADLNGGAGAQQLRGRYQDGTNDYGWQLASDGITFDFDNFSGASGTFYTFPTADATVDGQVLTGHADGTTTWEAVVATAALTDTYIGFGDSSNILTGDADFTYGSLYSLVSQVTPDNSDSLSYSTASFTGSGLDDLTLTWDSSIYASNKYGGNLTITIDTTGSPDTFNWYFTGGYSQTIGSGTSVAITGGVQTLNDADGNKIAEIQFGATTGHTATDHWNAHTSLGGNPKGYLLQDNLNHEFLVANSGGGTYKFGDDGTNGGSQWWGNGTQLFIADNNGELGLFAPRYLRFEHPVVGTYTAALVDMQNKIWDNYGKFRVRNATTSSDWFDVDPATQEIQIGDITSVGNDTLFTINDSSAIMTGTLDGVFTLQNVAGADGFVLDTANKTSQLGFISGTGINGNYLLIDDANHDSRIVTDSSGYFSVKGGSNILFQVNASGRAVSIGDVLAAVNGTKVVVDDVSQLVTITNVPTYADDTAAAAGGLTTGQLYKTTTLGITSLNIVP